MKQIVKLLMVAIFATATCTMAFAQNLRKETAHVARTTG